MEMAASCQSSRRTSTCPSWLQSVITDITHRVNTLTETLESTNSDSDSFSARAENYYEIRPQLTSLLQDLHSHYLQLAHRYSLSLSKLANSTSTTTTASFSDDDDDGPPISTISTMSDMSETSCFVSDHGVDVFESVVVEFVFGMVERNFLMEEVEAFGKVHEDSLRKIELQRSLLEVMESERLVLVMENDRLGQRSRAMESEVGYTRRKARELAECIIRMREGQRVELLRRRVEALERREKEWGEAIRRREREKVESRVELEKLREENRRLRRKIKKWWCVGGGGVGRGKKGKNVGGWVLWDSCFCF